MVSKRNCSKSKAPLRVTPERPEHVFAGTVILSGLLILMEHFFDKDR